MVVDREAGREDHEAMTTTAADRHHWPRRHPYALFWALTAPLVFQLTYTLMDGSSGAVDSTYAVWATYLMVQFGYALLLIGLVRVSRVYWDWVDRI
jgi:Na+/melibiose symporter-like transporter